MTTVYGVGVKRGSTCLLPEISASLSHVSYRDSEAFGIPRINDSAIPSDDVSTIDILHTIFLQISSHEKTPPFCIYKPMFPTGRRRTQKREPVTLPLRKVGTQSTLVLTRNPHWEYLALLGMMDLAIFTHEVWTEDKPHASSFLRKMIVGHTDFGFELIDRRQRPAELISAKTPSTGLGGKSLAGQAEQLDCCKRLRLTAMTIIFLVAKIRQNKRYCYF